MLCVMACCLILPAAAQNKPSTANSSDPQSASSRNGSSVALLKPRYIMVNGAGMAIEQDKDSAHQEADDQAQSNMNSQCEGTMQSSKKIFDSCTQAGDTWTCNINYTGVCVIDN